MKYNTFKIKYVGETDLFLLEAFSSDKVKTF